MFINAKMLLEEWVHATIKIKFIVMQVQSETHDNMHVNEDNKLKLSM